jgi:hypothetical protein
MNKQGLVYSTGRKIKPTFSTDEQIIKKYMLLYDLTKREAIKKLQLLQVGIQMTCINKFENQ